jgi:hypothetical protein
MMRAALLGSCQDSAVGRALRVLFVIAVVALGGMLTGVVPMPVAWAMIIVAALGVLATGAVGLRRTNRHRTDVVAGHGTVPDTRAATAGADDRREPTGGPLPPSSAVTESMPPKWSGAYRPQGAVWVDHQGTRRPVAVPQWVSIDYLDERSGLMTDESTHAAGLQIWDAIDRIPSLEGSRVPAFGLGFAMVEPPELLLDELSVTVGDPDGQGTCTWGLLLAMPLPWLSGEGSTTTHATSGSFRFEVSITRAPGLTELAVAALGPPAPYLAELELRIARHPSLVPWDQIHLGLTIQAPLEPALGLDMHLALESE